MKDSNDSSTGNLLASPGARRQAAFKARKRAAGFTQKTVWIRPEDYARGVCAGDAGQTSDASPPGVDRRSWALGYCDALERAQEKNSHE